MKQVKVVVPWPEGLHLRPASRIVAGVREFRSTITLKARERAADARSVLGLLLLCASLGTVVEVEVAGEDEAVALAAVETLFEASARPQADADGESV